MFSSNGGKIGKQFCRFDHTNDVFIGFERKKCKMNMLSRSPERIFNPIRYTRRALLTIDIDNNPMYVGAEFPYKISQSFHQISKYGQFLS